MRYPNATPENMAYRLRLAVLSLSLIAIGISIGGCRAAPTRETVPANPPIKISTSAPADDARGESPAAEPAIQFKTIADANAEVSKLGSKQTPESLAALVSELDSWPVEPAEQDAFQQLELSLLGELRGLVKKKVEARQNFALQTPRSADGAKALEEAARVLALYPVSNDPGVVNEARQLSRRQVDTATRFDVLRRQRYNQWATGEIERAINYYNENVSRWNPFNNNAGLIQPLAAVLGPIDPVHLEPVVLELYNYVVNKVSGKLSELNRLSLAKQLTDPSNKRRIPGEF